MALTYTPQGELGSDLPNFSLPSVFGEMVESRRLKSRPSVIAFICAHCPYVQAIEDRLIQLGHDLKAMDVPLVAICANDPSDYPEDQPAALARRAKDKAYSFPYLIDESQDVAKAFGAVCTPDFFVYDSSGQLAYRGRLDDSWKDAQKVSKRELFEAVKRIVAGQEPAAEQHPAMGCSIKWK